MKLLGAESVGGIITRDFMHVGDDGRDKITTVTSQETNPIIQNVKDSAQSTPGKDMRLRAKIPANLVNEACKQSAAFWGTTPRGAFAEMVASKSDRSKKLWNLLSNGRDFSKFQVKSY